MKTLIIGRRRGTRCWIPLSKLPEMLCRNKEVIDERNEDKVLRGRLRSCLPPYLFKYPFGPPHWSQSNEDSEQEEQWTRNSEVNEDDGNKTATRDDESF